MLKPNAKPSWLVIVDDIIRELLPAVRGKGSVLFCPLLSGRNVILGVGLDVFFFFFCFFPFFFPPKLSRVRKKKRLSTTQFHPTWSSRNVWIRQRNNDRSFWKGGRVCRPMESVDHPYNSVWVWEKDQGKGVERIEGVASRYPDKPWKERIRKPRAWSLAKRLKFEIQGGGRGGGGEREGEIESHGYTTVHTLLYVQYSVND